jgi:hypothetical protein
MAILALFSLSLALALVRAQPSPAVQERIAAAIAAAANNASGEIDYTQFVNPFIGTGAYACFSPMAIPDSSTQTTLATCGKSYSWDFYKLGSNRRVLLSLAPARLFRLVWCVRGLAWYYTSLSHDS